MAGSMQAGCRTRAPMLCLGTHGRMVESQVALGTTLYPFRTVVQITGAMGLCTYQGSGVLIAPDEVLTASHMVQTTGLGTATNIVVTRGYAGGLAPFGSATGTIVHDFPVDDTGGLIYLSDIQTDFAVIGASHPKTW